MKSFISLAWPLHVCIKWWKIVELLVNVSTNCQDIARYCGTVGGADQSKLSVIFNFHAIFCWFCVQFARGRAWQNHFYFHNINTG